MTAAKVEIFRIENKTAFLDAYFYIQFIGNLFNNTLMPFAKVLFSLYT